MLYRVILSHHQTENIRKFPHDEHTVFVFDAPTAEDIKECEALGCRYVLMPSAGHRGMNRNTGLQFVLQTFAPNYDDYVEFFDGDRYPTDYNPEKVQKIMQENHIDCMLYSCERDARHQKIFVPLSGATLVDTGTLCNPFYSCGFCMRVGAIQDIMAYNNGFLFEPRFDKWGSEDQFLGLECEHLHFRVAMTNETLLNGSVGGDSDQHQDYRESLQTYVDLIREHDFPIRNKPRDFVVV